MRHTVHEDLVQLRGKGEDIAIALGEGPGNVEGKGVGERSICLSGGCFKMT